MMKSMQQWAADHGLFCQTLLPMDVEYVHPPEVEFEDDADDWCEHCDNMGFVNCYCGGDLCVCRNHGEKPCPKCGYL